MDLERLKIDRGPQGRRKRRRRARGLGWLVALLVAAALVWLFRAPLMERVDRLRLQRVETQRVRPSNPLAASAVSGTAASGYVVASKRAALSADTPGRIVEMNVTEGSVVQRGDVVARLYSEEHEAALRQAEAALEAARAAVQRSEAERGVAARDVERLRSAEAAAQAGLEEAQAAARLTALDLERARELVGADIQSRQSLDAAQAADERARAQVAAARASAQAAAGMVEWALAQEAVADAAVLQTRRQVEVAQAAREQAEATLAKTFVRAPFDGIVVLKDAEVGEVVSPNAQGGNSRGAVATMVDFDSLEVQVEVPEINIAAVEIGAPANIYLDAYPAEPYHGRVERIWPTANRQKATIEVRVGIDDPDPRLRPEMGARVVFSPQAPPPGDGGGEPEGLLVPASAVVQAGGGSAVFVVERGVVELRPVELAGERSGRALVRAGLREGEVVVVAPPPRLAAGDRVVVEER